MRNKKIAVIGGGAAGFCAAIRAAEVCCEARVDLYERSGRVLTKVALTGGGRCNLTNTFAQVDDLRQVYPRGSRLMKRLLRVFGPKDTVKWFEACGVPTVAQEDERVFPLSQSALTVTEMLQQEARRMGVKFFVNRGLNMLRPTEGKFVLRFDGDAERAVYDRVVLAVGGMQEGNLYHMLEHLGHEMQRPVPSLFTFNIADAAMHQLAGLTVERVAMGLVGERIRSEGALLLTHWGISGPAVLKLSSNAARWMAERGWHCSVYVDWMGGLGAERIEKWLCKTAQVEAARMMSHANPPGVPSRLWLFLMGRAGLRSDMRWAELGTKGRNRMVETLTHDVYAVEGKSPFKEEFVTCGGVSLSSIKPDTLESRQVEGLFFAGEMLDVDGVTGGFNLQAAWTTGCVAGENAAK